MVIASLILGPFQGWLSLPVLLGIAGVFLVVNVGLAALAYWLWRRYQRPSTGSPLQPAAGAPRAQSHCPRCGSVMSADAAQGLCPRCVFEAGMGVRTGSGTAASTIPRTQEPPPSAEDMGRHFPQLEILECLGRGGMGMVYKARQPKLNRIVALKVLSQEKGADPRFAERFLREAQALARLDHPNIVAVHEFGEAEGLYFLIMEYVDGLTLRQLLREGKVAPEEALAIVPSICEALQYAHGKGVVHRDIKPENVLISREGQVKIADFGIAKILDAGGERANLTAERQVIGTPHYMAPEQVENPQRVDHRADIFSLGVVFYELLTGELPLGRFAPPSARLPGIRVDVRLDEVVLKALEKEPARRYQQAGEVRTAVESLSLAPPPPPVAAVPQAVGPRAAFGLARWIGLAVGLLTILLTAGATFLLPKSYLSTVRFTIERVVTPALARDPFFLQTEFELIQSSPVLRQVVVSLDLRGKWAARFFADTLSDTDCIALLRRMIQVRQVRNASMIEVLVMSHDRDEAAQIANGIAAAYASQTKGAKATIVDPAIPALQASRPNVPLNLGVGVALAFALGFGAAGVVILFTWRPREVTRPMVSPSGKARLALGLFLAGTLGTLVLMTLSPRHEMALLFGALALVLALVFGVLARRERLGKWVAIAVLVLVGVGGLATAVMTGFMQSRATQRARAEALQAEKEARDAAIMAEKKQSQAASSRMETGRDRGEQPKEAGGEQVVPSREEKPSPINAPAGLVPRRDTSNPVATSVPPAVIDVRLDGTGHYTSIQAAIRAAPPGSVIRIGPGRFDETLSLLQSVTLTGAGWDKTTIGPTQPWKPLNAEELKKLQEELGRGAGDSEAGRRMAEEATSRVFQSVVRVRGARDVKLQDLGLTLPGLPNDGRLEPIALLELHQADVALKQCRLVGSPGIGILVHEGSRLGVQGSLVAATWNSGIAIERGTASHVVLADTEIRNCYYAGITIGRGQDDVVIRGCRIAGAAWHGVRYDNAAPKILGNLIFGHARSGIYASGRTAAEVRGNVFADNEMNGMSCWYDNGDVIAGNTFVNNRREGLAILGSSAPTIQSNIFSGHPVAILQGRINSRGDNAILPGTPRFLSNILWDNRTNFVDATVGEAPASGDLPEAAASLLVDPEFRDTAARDFTLKPGSRALQGGIGCLSPMPFVSPWPLQPEEAAMIPDGSTRDSKRWKR